MAISLRGSVTLEDGTPLPGVAVTVVGPAEALAQQEIARTQRGDHIVWSRVLTGLTHYRWNVWQKHVKDQVPGMPWEEFKDEVFIHNPELDRDHPVFRPEKSYVLPQRVTSAPQPIYWSRLVSGFSGNRWQAWERFVRGSVAGITWAEFVSQVVEENPELAADAWVFKPGKMYRLPQNIAAPVIVARLQTDGTGLFSGVDLPGPGRYEFVLECDGFQDHREQHDLSSVSPLVLTMEPLAPDILPSPEPPRGFVQAGVGELRLHGQPFRFVGTNIRGLVHYGDGRILSAASRPEDADRQLDAALRMGARVVRVFLTNRHCPPDEVVARLRHTLQLLDDRDLYAIAAFTDVHSDTPFQVQGDLARFYTANGMLGREFFAGGYKVNYLPFVQQRVGPFKDHPRILAWELGNEPKAQDNTGAVLPQLFIDFAHHVTNEIRAIDPHHLVATGVINSGNLGMDAALAERLYGHPGLGLLTVHVYPDKADPEVGRADAEAELARRLRKPFIIEEIGFREGDRGAKTRAALNEWFNGKGAKGFMQWGLMATDHDNGDGDHEFGMDRKWHGDYPALEAAYRAFADALAL